MTAVSADRRVPGEAEAGLVVHLVILALPALAPWLYWKKDTT